MRARTTVASVAHAFGRALRIELFGSLRVEIDGRAVTADLPGRQGRTLLAYLVLNRGRPVDRDELLRVLWPTALPADPQASLSSVLAKVRRAVGPDLISGRAALTFAPQDAQLDVQQVAEGIERAERAVAAKDPPTALDAAQATLRILEQPLLPGLQGPWLASWYASFAEYERRGLEAMARAGLMLGGDHLASAERAAHAALERHPYRESGYGLLMEIQAARGDVAEALRTFDRVRVLLRDELGISPAPALVALHGSVLRQDVPARVGEAANAQPQPLAFPMPEITTALHDATFIGREACVRRLRRRWRESRAGQARLVLLVGETGVGKTSLANGFAEEVHADGGVVLYGRADEDALLPYQPFVEAVRSLLAYGGEALAEDTEGQRDVLSRLIPGICPPWGARTGDGDYQALRFQLFEAVVYLLTSASRRWPLLLVLDDLQWADNPTLLLLRHLLRQPQVAHLLVIGTFREGEVGRAHGDLLADLRRERPYDRITLGGLDESSTRTLVAERLGRDVTPCFIRRLREQTDGNPLFIDETLRALVQSGLPVNGALAAADLERLGVPEGVAEVIVRRVRRLSPLAAEILTVAAIMGRDFRMGVLETLIEASTDEIMSALEESIAGGLIVEVREHIDVFAFSNAAVREVLYGQLTTSRRVRLHHRVGVALEATAQREVVNPAELAHHFHLARHFAGPGPAREYAILAGDRAARLLAYEEACEHYSRALALFTDDEEAQRCDVLLALGRVQRRAGDDAARHNFLAAADSASARGAVDQLSEAALRLGERWFEAAYGGSRCRELLEEAVGVLDAVDSPLRALLLARLAEHVGFPREHARAIALSGDALRMARRLGDENVLISTMLARHVTLSDARHLDERFALSEELMSLEHGHRGLLAERHHWRLYDLITIGDLEAARDEQGALEALAGELRQPLLQSLAVGWRGVWAELAGDAALAERCAEECLRHAQRAHTKDALGNWAARLVMLRRRERRLSELTGVVEQLARGSALGTGWPSVLALIHAESGQREIARAIYERELSSGVEGLPRGMVWLTNMTLLSELCAKLDDGARARRLYDVLAPHADRNVVVGYSSCWGPVEGSLALLAATMGDRELAARHFRSALARARALGAPLLEATLEERHRELLAR